MKTLVLGLGNPILGDDGVGIRVLEQLRARFDNVDLTFKESCASGLDLLQEITGYDRLIIIDAIQTKTGRVGHIYRLTMDDFTDSRLSGSPHNIDLAAAVELGKKLGECIPQQIDIFAIEVADVTDLSERCTPEVEKTIPLAVNMVANELNNILI